MALADLLVKECVLSELKATDKRELLEEMVACIESNSSGISGDEIIEGLLEREQLGSTGIGFGVAIPHCKLQGLDKVIIAFGRSVEGVDYQAPDDEPVRIVFLIVAPVDSASIHLEVLADISKLTSNGEVRERLLGCETSDEVIKVITEGAPL